MENKLIEPNKYLVRKIKLYIHESTAMLVQRKKKKEFILNKKKVQIKKSYFKKLTQIN